MIDDKVQSVVRSLSETRGKDFFNNIVPALGRAIDSDFTFVARLNEEHTIATTIALAIDDKIAENFCYALKDTPCAQVAENNVCIHTQNIQSQFPADQLLIDMGVHAYVGTPLFDRSGKVIGIMVALFRDKINNASSVESLFLLFSGLVGGELEKRQQTQQLVLAQRALDTTSDTVVICNSDRKIIYVNAAFEKISGYDADEVIGRTPGDLKSGHHDQAFYEAMWETIRTKGSWAGEVKNRKKDGSLYLIWLTISLIKNSEGEVTHYTGIAHDITAQKASEEKIHFQATHDLLTGLPNRHQFHKYLSQSISVSNRNRKRIAVVLLDLDQFKVINDTLGHKVGDNLLLQVSKRLKEGVRDSDVIARLGGDEFALLLHDINSVKEISAVVDKLLDLLRQPLIMDERPCEVTASIGITLFPEDNSNAEELLAHADQAMYTAKQRGRDGFSFFNATMQLESEQRLRLKEQLRQAIDNQEFNVYYQPIIDLKTQQVSKCEALIRWKSLDNVFIPPDRFIPVAEEFGYIASIGEQVLETTCRDLQQLRDLGYSKLSISVNRSVQEFPRSSAMVNHWLDTIQRFELPSGTISFEITESLLAPENRIYLKALDLLKSSGAAIAIDDFGTGYSSLSYLQRFPVDILKIDRSFISPMSGNPDEHMLVASIIAMAKTLGIEVVAEGIETREQYELLGQLGCDYGQGFFIAKPMPMQDLIGFMNN